MKNKKSLLIIVLIFVVILLGAALLYRQLSDNFQDTSLTAPTASSTDPTDPEYMTAPNVTITDADGNPVNLHDYFGKPIILNFWASWCGPCQSEMPALEEAYLANGEDIHFLMINLTDGSRETMESAKASISQSGYTFPIYFDTTMEATITYGASSIPLTFFIDAEGNLIARHIGALTEDLLQQGMDLIR